MAHPSTGFQVPSSTASADLATSPSPVLAPFGATARVAAGAVERGAGPLRVAGGVRGVRGAGRISNDGWKDVEWILLHVGKMEDPFSANASRMG